MRLILLLLIFDYVISKVSDNDTFAYHNMQSAYQFLIQNQDQLILGLWSASSEHLVYLNIVFDNQNLLLQVYPKNYDNEREIFYFRLSYQLRNISYQFDSVNNRMTWNNIQTEVILQNTSKHVSFSCIATIQLETQSKYLNIYSEFKDECQMNEEQIKLIILNKSNYSLKVQVYSALVICISIFQIINSHYYLNSDPMPNYGGSITMSIILTQDIYICIFGSLLFDAPRFFYFIPCLISQLIIILSDLKLKTKLLQKQDYNKKQILIFLIEMLIITFLFLQIQNFYGLILLNFFLSPQIVFTFFTGMRQKFNCNYMGTIFPRVILSLYFTGYPNNILKIKQNFLIFGIILLTFLIQYIIYFCQCKYGLFIWMNIKFNYFVKLTDEHSNIDCSICLINLKNSSDQQLNSEEPVLIQSLNMATQRQLLMNTPCKHLYHPSCLINWMQINLTCPLCKSSLPQIC